MNADSTTWPELVDASPNAILLKTARPDEENHHSYLFTNPLRVLVAHCLEQIPGVFDDVEDALTEGAYVAGFVSYEAGHHFEPASAKPDLQPSLADLPLAWFGVYPRPLVADETLVREDSRIEETHAEIQFNSSAQPETYASRVERIHRYIEAGDIYQANLLLGLQAQWPFSAPSLFRRMLANQPTAYGAFINTGKTKILSASPELFFRRAENEIVTRPMKGTTPRGRDSAEDAAQANWLHNDEKNRAENVMIVDLLRNDLGRICEPGSVRVRDLFSIEKHPTVFQMTSTIEGWLRSGLRQYDIFRSLFPCGSITGAPKMRAMQIIRQLECEPRGVACGAIGFFAPGGNAVFSVAIRTVALRGTTATLNVGSGITHSSSAEHEYAECLLKARFISQSPEPFQLIETLRWSAEYTFLDLHLDRLADSAAYFDFHCSLAGIRSSLLAFAADLRPATPHRVRLLLERSGQCSISSELFADSPAPVSLTLAEQPTSSSDVFLRHKTTRRALYDRALSNARSAGFTDALFQNEHGDITECAIHNIMIERAGELLTPPLDCGVLPGVYRRHLLASDANVKERVIRMDDLRAAERVFIFNSVRDMREVASISDGSDQPLFVAPAARLSAS